MSLIAKEKTGSDIPPVPEGVYTAVCYSIIDIGVQYSERFDKAARKVVISWEIPEHRIDLERNGMKANLPRAISSRYTLSLGEKAILRRDLNAWRGRAFTEAELKGFDLKKLLGAACQLQVIHAVKDSKTFANVGTLMALPKGVKPPKPENELLFFSLNELAEQEGLPVLPKTIPEWISKLIKESREWEKLTLKAQKPTEASKPAELVPAGAVAEDDVPF